jgi:hypothetical protein
LGSFEDLHPGLDGTHIGQLDMSMGVLAAPLLPAFCCWITNLEDEMAAGPKRRGSGLENRSQLLICQEHLSDVARHRHELNLEGRKGRRVTQDPPHLIGTWLPPGYFKRSRGRIETKNGDPALSEKAGEGACSAPDVKHRSSAQRMDKGDVGIEIGSVRLEGVIDLRKSSLFEDRVGHFTALAVCRFAGHERAEVDVATWPKISKFVLTTMQVISGARCQSCGVRNPSRRNETNLLVE